jgi:hypothetical protein
MPQPVIKNMDFRTTFNIRPSSFKITYNDPAVFIGSCFATSIGKQLETGRIPVLINPAGTVYNPVSVFNNLNMIVSKRVFVSDDLYNNNGLYLSFFHNTEFSSGDSEKVLNKINSISQNAYEFFASAKFLFITFGTARIYRLKKNGMIVSNCHKLPSDYFIADILSVEEIVTLWSEILERLNILYPKLKVIFTISPVRHWKDGAHGNQISKSVLFLAVEKLLNHNSSPDYFPAYELLMDDLRDYRFYDDDLLHPSSEAIKYIWDSFAAAYLDKKTIDIWRDVVKISRATEHNLSADSPSGMVEFGRKMLENIDVISAKAPWIDFSSEKDYFLSLLKRK